MKKVVSASNTAPRGAAMVTVLVVGLVAGGAFRGGQVVGETDATAAEPASTSYSPDDLAASLFANIGIPPHTEFQSNVGRPITLVRDGSPIKQLF